ncbi:sulfotransferase family 2 domain-containing protein [Pseudanabaenaceae cyanobacterium LEGE 13415]|nr:sulfotransferase family 2 domain-containing protein [Pseudanabaenaceae cyanobacterium LEGE 13415]
MSPIALVRRIKHTVRPSLKEIQYKLQGKQTVHFLHIGKTAGSAFRDAVSAHLVTDRYRIQLHGHSVTLNDVPPGEKVIFFLRDPIARFASGFYSRLRQGKPRYNNPWRPHEAIAFSRFHTPQALAAALSAEEDELREAAIYAMTHIGHVKSHLWNWFIDEAYFVKRWSDILFIGYQESFDADFVELKQILGLPESVQLPQSKTQAHRSSKHENKQFSDLERENLLQWYAADYEFLALCQQLQQGQARKLAG